MLETLMTTRCRVQSRTPFASSALLHAVVVLLLIHWALPPAGRKSDSHSVMLYFPAARTTLPAAGPELRRKAVQLFFPQPDLPVLRPFSEVRLPEALPAKVPEPPAPPISAPKIEAPPAKVPTVAPGEVFGSRNVLGRNTPQPGQRVQTGAFGSADTLPSRDLSASTNLRVGTFESKHGATPAAVSRAPAGDTGFGSAVAGKASRTGVVSETATGVFDGRVAGSAVRISRPVAVSAIAGFGVTAIPLARATVQGTVSRAQFESATVQAARTVKAASGGDRTAALEILYKPRPAYSSEARDLQLEGEVVLEALFEAGGEIKVLRVLRGLGHGLDESAVQAAMAIRFRAALERGRPVDTIAAVRIEFQLAH